MLVCNEKLDQNTIPIDVWHWLNLIYWLLYQNQLRNYINCTLVSWSNGGRLTKTSDIVGAPCFFIWIWICTSVHNSLVWLHTPKIRKIGDIDVFMSWILYCFFDCFIKWQYASIEACQFVSIRLVRAAKQSLHYPTVLCCGTRQKCLVTIEFCKKKVLLRRACVHTDVVH